MLHRLRILTNWPPHIKVAVNLSPAQFQDEGLLETVSGILTETRFPPERLELEIPESILMQGSDENLNILHQLRSLGISIVLDDFGTGYSSLSYLQPWILRLMEASIVWKSGSVRLPVARGDKLSLRGKMQLEREIGVLELSGSDRATMEMWGVL